MGNWKDGSVDKILHKHKALVQIPRHIQKLDTGVSVTLTLRQVNLRSSLASHPS